MTDRAPSERRDRLASAGCEVAVFPGEGPVPVGMLLQELGRRGMTNILVEGGGRVLGSFLDSGEVDAAEVFIAPILEGGDHPRDSCPGRPAGAWMSSRSGCRRPPPLTVGSAMTPISAAGCSQRLAAVAPGRGFAGRNESRSNS